MDKIKVLHLVNGFPTDKHPEYCVFTKEQIESLKKNKELQTSFYFINAREKGKLEYLKAIYKLPKLIKKVDVVHCFHGLTFLLIVLLTNKPILVSFLNSIENEYGVKNTLFSKIFRKLTILAIRKKNVFKIFKDKVPEKYSNRSFYLPNGVDLNKFYPLDKEMAKLKIGLDISKKYVLFVSSKNINRPQKRYDKFQKVMKHLKERYNDIEELKLVNEKRENIIYYFNASEFHLLTSDYEGSPNSVKESLSCNTPVVSTNVGNVYEMLNGINKTKVVSDDSVKSLFIACCELLDSDLKKLPIDTRASITEKGLDIESKANELLEIYKKIIA